MTSGWSWPAVGHEVDRVDNYWFLINESLCLLQAGKSWNGVGHRMAAGNGARNPFGVAFEAAGEVSFAQVPMFKVQFFV